MKEEEKNISSFDIDEALFGWNHAEWKAEIVFLLNKNKYKAKLWVWDEYDDYLVQWKVYLTSPELDTLEEAETYIEEEWINA
jgi:hypothetical protein